MERTEPFAGSQVLIRKPVTAVFNAFIDPSQTVNFWFTHSSGKLEAGTSVTWKWEMYGAEATVDVLEIIPNQRISINWNGGRRVDFLFTDRNDRTTYVECIESGYTETGDALINVIRDSTGGFTTVVDGLKAWLEHGVKLNLIGDKFAGVAH